MSLDGRPATGASDGVVNASEGRNADIPLINLRGSIDARVNTPANNGIRAQPAPTAKPKASQITSNGSGQAPNGDPLAHLAFVKRDPPVSRGPYFSTEVDIIGVPAIGGDPEKTWTPSPVYSQDELHTHRPSEIQKAIMEMTPVSLAYSSSTRSPHVLSGTVDKVEPAWITRGIRNRKDLRKARVLLYDHGYPEDDDTLKKLANRLLHNIDELRRIEKERRPLFFVCHSTGGLVVKMALAEAQRSKNPILGDCYGVTFFATPHRGSSYLSMPDFSNRIAQIMELSRPLPKRIASQLHLDHRLLRTLGTDFKAIATDLHIWTFFETIDSDLTNPDLVELERFPFHAPITSIKSALLNLRHEVVYPLISDHRECASFGNNNSQTKASYLDELARAVKMACDLRGTIHNDMFLDQKVMVEINGFYEGTVLAPNSDAPIIRVWSTSRSLSDFMRHGPSKLLEDRLAEVTTQPRQRQHLQHNTRALSLLPDKPVDSISPESGVPTFKTSHLFAPPASEAPPTKASTKASSKRHRKTDEMDKESQSNSQDVRLTTTTPTLVVSTSEIEIDPNAPLTAINLKVPDQLEARGPVVDGLGVTTSLQTSASALHPHTQAHLSVNGMNPISTNRRRHSEVPPPQSSLLKPTMSHRNSASRGRRGSEGAINESLPITFTKPDISQQRLVWVHLPFNNPTWVRDILGRISIDKGRDCHEKLLSPENWKSRHVRGRHSEHHACFLKPGCSLIGSEITSPLSSPKVRQGSPKPGPIQMCLFLPLLHWDTYKVLVKRRALIKRRIKQGRSRPVPQSVAKLQSLELRVIWQFLGHDPPINCRRTLDQFGYPSLLDTRARDDDQMLYKMTKQRIAHPDDEKTKEEHIDSKPDEYTDADEGDNDTVNGSDGSDAESESDLESDEDILDGNVLMVDQLWLWIVDNETTVTFFSRKEPLASDGRLYQQADLHKSIFNEVNADLTSRCENSFDLAALVALHAVTVLLERSSHPDLEIFRTFEEAISILTEKMTTSFKKFRAQGFRDKATDYDNAVRTTNIRAKHKLEGLRAEKQNRENTSALLELRDIEDELHTLKELFNKQTSAIFLMIENYKQVGLHSLTANGLVFLKQAETKLQEYTHHVEKMIESVKSTRDDFDKLLGMVQRQAQVDEVRLSRLQADLASAQSRSVMIFTVFTVIFLPLTFFTGLFGMNTQEWGGSNFLSLRIIGYISLPVSFLIITVALIVAWSTRMRRLFNKILKLGKLVVKEARKITADVIAYIPASTITDREKRKKSIEGKREKKRQKREAKKEASWLDEDFWESHVIGREKDYKLPLQNRKSVGLARRKMEMGKSKKKEKGRGEDMYAERSGRRG